MSRLTSLLFVIAVAACGGRSGSATTPGNTGGGSGGAAAAPRLPWESALTVGATFTLRDETGDGEPVVVKVTRVEDKGNERVYSLDWGEGGDGPRSITVRDGVVLVGGAAPEDMQDPVESPAGTCYGEDFSNPDGCEDVCDASLCLNEAGIVSVYGLYAPGQGMYVAE